MKRIGLLGGISAMSTIEYYRLLVTLYYEKFQNHYYPEILINSLDFGYFTELENRSDPDAYIDYILCGIRQLEKAGADFIAMTANSPHSVLTELKLQTRLPVISIVDAVLDEIARDGNPHILLTGIRHTMQSDFYPRAAAQRNIQIQIPNILQQTEIERLIFDELSAGVIREQSLTWFTQLIDQAPCDGVILGCTELPLLLKQEHCSKKLYNSMLLHCQAILKEALR